MHIGKNVVAELKRIEVERIRSDNALLLQPLDARADRRRGQEYLLGDEDSRTSPARVLIGVREFFCSRRSSFRSISSIGR